MNERTVRRIAAFLFCILLWGSAPIRALCESAVLGETQPIVTPSEPGETPTPTLGPEGIAEVGSMDVPAMKPKWEVTLAVPIVFRIGTELYYTNALDGGSIAKYDENRSRVSGYNAAILNALDRLVVKIEDSDSSPFEPTSLGAYREVVSTLSGSNCEQLGLTAVTDGSGNTVYQDAASGYAYPAGVKFNAGFAVFTGLKVKSDAANGYHNVPLTVHWESAIYGNGSTSIAVKVRVVNAASTGSTGGGSYYGGGGTSATPAPEAKLLVSGVRTDPENPVAGDEFDIVFEIENTSEKEYVQNITLTCDAESDAVLPVSGAFNTYIRQIEAAQKIEERIRVRAQTDIEDRPVKLNVLLSYEDSDVTALSNSQTLVINVGQLLRIKLDEPVLPSDGSITGETYAVSMGVFNLGRTTLYNVTVNGVSESGDLSTGASYYCGNMESGTSKTAEIRFTPMKEGAYTADLQVTYENGRGESFTETKSISFYSTAYVEDDWFTEGDTEEPAPTVAPSAAQKTLEVMSILPWWLYAAAGGLMLLLIVSIGVSARRRRMRALEDDEME